jgi:hypothetical protein
LEVPGLILGDLGTFADHLIDQAAEIAAFALQPSDLLG